MESEKILKVLVLSYWREIAKIIKSEGHTLLLNDSSKLKDRIQSGDIKYKNNRFSGKFGAEAIKELRKFSEYDKAKNEWVVKKRLPNKITKIIKTTKANNMSLASKLLEVVQNMKKSVKNYLKKANFSIKRDLQEASDDLERDLSSIGIIPKINRKLAKKLEKSYKKNQSLNIVGFTTKQERELRQAITEFIQEGLNKKKLIKIIENRYSVSRSKASFLARQETSLYLSKYRQENCIQNGVNYYTWQSVGDVRTVGNPSGKYPNPTKGHGDHHFLDGKICNYKDGSVYADSVTDAKLGKWKKKSTVNCTDNHPGEDFNCRCVANPIII